MTYTETVKMKRSEFDRVNRLLEIPSLEEMTDEELRKAGANTRSCEGIFLVQFQDGSFLNYDLCSGSVNYFDNVVWTSPDGCTDTLFESDFCLDDIEVEIYGNAYIVHIEKED